MGGWFQVVGACFVGVVGVVALVFVDRLYICVTDIFYKKGFM